MAAMAAPVIHIGKASAGGGGASSGGEGRASAERTVMVIVSVAVLPAASVTFRVIVYVPGLRRCMLGSYPSRFVA